MLPAPPVIPRLSRAHNLAGNSVTAAESSGGLTEGRFTEMQSDLPEVT